MRPITSAISSAPHRLAKALAKPLSTLLGSTSSTHVKNSAELVQKLKTMPAKNKKLASFDVKSLFTNVPIKEALEATAQAATKLDPQNLPLPFESYMALIALCTNFGAFKFLDEEYHQHSGLPMGSPLSPVLAGLFMESLEKKHYLKTCGTGVFWKRYVDDILIIANRRKDLKQLLASLNEAHPSIQFTLEEEKDGQLPFLDILIHRKEENFEFSVYRKPTNKNDVVHFYSAHSDKTKSGVVIGFYLRALRICSPHFLQEEIHTTQKIFQDMKYPTGILQDLLHKAKKIVQREAKEEKETTRLMVPHSPASEALSKILKPAGLELVTTKGRTTRQIATRPPSTKACSSSNSVVYSIPCSGCEAAYIGETGRGLSTRLKEHIRDMNNNRLTNAMVLHANRTGHLPRWDQATTLHSGISRHHRKALEAAVISTQQTTNTRPGNFAWAPSAAFALLQDQATKS